MHRQRTSSGSGAPRMAHPNPMTTTQAILLGIFIGAPLGVAIGLLIARALPQAIVVNVEITRKNPDDPADAWRNN
jgi:hypothetical protein